MTGSLRRRLGVALVALLALAATITSLGHDFTYDDRGVVFENEHVHTLQHLPHLFVETYWPLKYGGDGYRPVVVSLFALEWSAADGAPWFFHLANIVLAVATALAIYWCALALLPALGAFVAAALFAVHPVHVEVTGNVVGQSELLVALCLSLAIGLYLRRRRSTSGDLSAGDVLGISLLYAAGLFTKEHAIVLPGILVAAEFTVIPPGTLRRRTQQLRPLLLMLLLVSSAYLFARSRVQTDLAGFVPYPIFRFLRMSTFDRIATMMNELPRVAQLLVFPTHLSGDYSPNEVLVANGFDLSQIPGFFILLATGLLAFVTRTRSPAVSFGLFWLMIAYAPVSNLLVPAGFLTAERTLFFPSVGVVLVAAALAVQFWPTATRRGRRWATIGFTALVAAGLARSVDRQRVWKDNDTFFEALMRDAPNGYRTHFLYARHVGLKSRLSEMEREYRKAIRIFPYDAAVTVNVADAYTRIGLCGPAVTLFEWSFRVEPTAGDGRYQYVWCLAKLNRWEDVRREAILGLPLVKAGDSRLMRAALREATRQLAIRR